MDRLTITQPDDWHLHLRSGAMLNTVMGHTAAHFGRALVMPNLKPPIVSVAQALAYRQDIIKALPLGSGFTPLMSLYLTATTSIDDVKRVAQTPEVLGFKLYPAGATTHSDAGVSNIQASAPVFESMQQAGVPLLIHGEVTDSDCDIFDRERRFIDSHLRWLSASFPALKMVMEHVTTQEAVAFVEAAPAHVAATITPQHLLFNRNAMLVGGIRPHFYCLPVLKRETHRLALLRAASSGNPKFFLGTDSAPHLTHLKENACGCAGCYSAPVALSLYAEAFEQAGALDKLEGFASHFGADFYGLPRNTAQIQFAKKPWSVPTQFGDADNPITPLQAGEQLTWQVGALSRHC